MKLYRHKVRSQWRETCLRFYVYVLVVKSCKNIIKVSRFLR